MRSFKFQVLAVLVAASLLLATVACNQSQIAAEVQIIGNAGASLAAILNNPTLAAKLKTDTADAVAAINGWKAGTPCQNVEQAIQVLMTDYNDIAASFGSAVPPNVTALIGLATTTVLAILALMPGCQVPAALQAKGAKAVGHPAADAKDFKARWNSIVASDPSLAGAKIK
jgi:hypothetical protein